jgi:hypothetical protein
MLHPLSHYDLQLTNIVYRPQKPKNGGTTAGIARAGVGRDRDLTAGNGVDSSEEVRQPDSTLALSLAAHSSSRDHDALQASSSEVS